MSVDILEVASAQSLALQLRQPPKLALPQLLCPFEPAIHADAGDIQRRSVEWAGATGLARGEKAQSRLRAAKIGHLAARGTPEGDRAVVQIAADWTTLFCLLDDHLERLPSPAAVTGCLARLAVLLRAGGAPGEDPMEIACADLHARLSAVTGPARISRVADRVDELFAMFSREARVRAAGAIPALGPYVLMREITVGVHVELELGELACGIELSEPTRKLPVFRSLRRKTCNLVGWANDIFTYEKELRAGEGTNLVAVLARAEGLSLKRALARAAAWHDEEVRSFVALAARALPSAPEEAEAFARALALLRAWVRGHLDWAHETGRYDPGLAASPA